jgi:putative ABC transport system permease protein
VVTPGYFKAVGLKVLRGRGFAETDKPVWREKGQPEPFRRVVISEALAKLIFPNEDAVGRRVALWKGQGNSDAEVIGVAANSHERGLAAPAALSVYLPYGRNALTQEFVLHTASNPLGLMPALRSLVARLDPNLPVGGVRSFEEVVHRSVAPQRLSSLLLALFAGLALILATTGIYGVLSYSISRRTSEIGLRMALGASRGRVLKMTLGQGMWPAVVGIVLGVVGAGWLSKYLATLLFGIQPLDVMTYSIVALLLMATALLACYLPGRRAMQTDPAVALRTD